MRLALGAGVCNQGGRLEAFGRLQDGAGDIDRIVKGELVDDVDRGVVDTSQPSGELRAGRDFNLIREPADAPAKRPNLVVAIAAGYQEIGRMPQCPHAAFRRSPTHRLVEITEKRT